MTMLLERGIFRVYVLWMCSKRRMTGDDFIHIERQHGHELSAGKLYPVLAELTKAGYLKMEKKKEHGKLHKYYSTTEAGKNILLAIKRNLGRPMKDFLIEWLSAGSKENAERRDRVKNGRP
jgi:DNA-binding PadR family transcriptional regulator